MLLWISFVVVHVVVAVLGFTLAYAPMGDVTLVYQPWSTQAVHSHWIMGISEPWVYPQLALLPMLAARVFTGVVSYEIGWALLITLLNALAFAMLIGRGRSAGRATAGWFWLLFILLLGPVGLYRIDAVTVSLALAGCLWLVGRPWLASILLAVVTWMKVWPAALLAAAFVALRRRLVIVGGALLVSAFTLASIAALGGAANAFGFLTDQADRGLQIEAPVSTFYLWAAIADVPRAQIHYSQEMLTFEVTGPGVDAVISVITPLLIAAFVAVGLVGAVMAWRGASFAALFPPLALSLVLVFIVFNKVGSPQFMTWIIVPIAMGLVIRRHMWLGPALLALAIAGLTFAVYPIGYGALLNGAVVATSVITLRNALLIVLLVWAVVRLVRVPHRLRPRSPQTSADSTLASLTH